MKNAAPGEIRCHGPSIDAPWDHTNRHGIKEREQRDPLAKAMKLLGHLEGDQAAHRVSSEVVRTLGLEGADFLNVMCRHVLHCCVSRGYAVQPNRLNAVSRLIGG